MNPLSSTWLSCDFTSRASKQRAISAPYQIPDEATRLLRANLILEEALETIDALGFCVVDALGDGELSIEEHGQPLNLEKIIDGCCDVHYVSIGTLWACGVPDVPHIEEVNRANNDKFPNGESTPHPSVAGKFGKPAGWKGPDHLQYFPPGAS